MEDTANIIGFDALFRSMQNCRKGVLWKDSVASYVLNGVERTLTLARDLKNGRYRPRPVTHFRVTSPKPRDIASVCFRDRVYQRSMNDNEIYPVMTQSFIYDNWACQKGKGTDKARERLKSFLRRFHRKHGTANGWVLQCDVSGYYPNMRHDMTEALFRSRLRPAVADMAVRVLHEQYDGDKGYNPGSQLIQIAGISVLDKFDHYVKERLRAKLYLRYMDDFLIIHHDREYLERCMEEIKARLAELGFVLNPKKSRIYRLADGVAFLGFTFRLTSSGRVVMTIRSDSVRRQRRKLVRLIARSKRGLIPRDKVDESYGSWRNHASKGHSFKLLQRMDAFYKSLWRD